MGMFGLTECSSAKVARPRFSGVSASTKTTSNRSEEHTSELQSHVNLVCRLLLEKKKADTRSPCRSDSARRPHRSSHERAWTPHDQPGEQVSRARRRHGAHVPRPVELQIGCVLN